MSDGPVVAAFRPAPCAGGPLDASTVTLPDIADSFLAVDRSAGRAWLYTRGADGVFGVRTDPDDSLTNPGGNTGERVLDWSRLLDVDRLPVVDVIPAAEVAEPPPISV